MYFIQLRAFELELDEKRKPLEHIVTLSFGILEAYGQQLLSHYNDLASAFAMRIILKIFFAAVNVPKFFFEAPANSIFQLELPQYFKVDQNLEKWMNFLKAICDLPVPSDAESQPASDDEARRRDKIIYWSNKKWCGEIMSRFVQKYGNVRWVVKTEIDSARNIQSKYLVPFLETFVKALLRRKTHFVANKYTYFAAQFVFYAIKTEEMFNKLNPLLEELLLDVFLPMVFLTPKDLQTWKSDALEYIRKQEDQSNTNLDLKRQGVDSIALICKKYAPDGKLYLFKFMEFVGIVLANGVNPRTNLKTDLVWKQAILHCIGVLEEQISAIESISMQMETLLEQYVIPEFKNEIGFLRATACRLLGAYGQIEFKKSENVQVATECLLNCLSDSELPVRVYVSSSSLLALLEQLFLNSIV